MFQTCSLCHERYVAARNPDGLALQIDPEPLDSGPYALVGDLDNEPTAVANVPVLTGMDWPYNIAPGTPRYQTHRDSTRHQLAVAGIPLAEDVDPAEVEAEVNNLIATSRIQDGDDYADLGVIDVVRRPDGIYARPEY